MLSKLKAPIGRIIWGAILFVAGCMELWGITHSASDDTLSEFTHWAFQVDSVVGQTIFLIVWGSFSAWFAWHILTFMGKKGK